MIKCIRDFLLENDADRSSVCGRRRFSKSMCAIVIPKSTIALAQSSEKECVRDVVVSVRLITSS